MSEDNRPNKDTLNSVKFIQLLADHYCASVNQWFRDRKYDIGLNEVIGRIRQAVNGSRDPFQIADAIEMKGRIRADIKLVDIFRDIELVQQRTFDYLLDKWSSIIAFTAEAEPAIGDILQFKEGEYMHTGRVLETCPDKYCCAVLLNVPYYGEICRTVNYEDIICNLSRVQYASASPKVEEEAYPEPAKTEDKLVSVSEAYSPSAEVPGPVPTEPPKCICPATPVLVKGGVNVAIDTIVDSKYTGAVVCWNKDNNMVEYQKVISYSIWAGMQIEAEAAASASVPSREHEPMPEKVKERLLGELAGWRTVHPTSTVEATLADALAGCQEKPTNKENV